MRMLSSGSAVIRVEITRCSLHFWDSGSSDSWIIEIALKSFVGPRSEDFFFAFPFELGLAIEEWELTPSLGVVRLILSMIVKSFSEPSGWISQNGTLKTYWLNSDNPACSPG